MAKGNVVQIPVALGPNLTAEQVREIFALGEESVVFAMLELAAQLRRAEGRNATLDSPAAPCRACRRKSGERSNLNRERVE